jgi:uncharacterized protein (DUF362 family)
MKSLILSLSLVIAASQAHAFDAVQCTEVTQDLAAVETRIDALNQAFDNAESEYTKRAIVIELNKLEQQHTRLTEEYLRVCTGQNN